VGFDQSPEAMSVIGTTLQMPHTTAYSFGDVDLVPFPFAD
jgi:hypothetical protein